jgi:cytochrome c-type biogenesis protein CcmI
MSIFIISIALLIMIAIVAPFLSKKTKQEQSHSHVSEWEQEKELIFSQLSDLEYDYRMAKVSEQDYQQAKVDLSAKAASYTQGPKEEVGKAEQEVDREIAAYLQKHKGITNSKGSVSDDH